MADPRKQKSPGGLDGQGLNFADKAAIALGNLVTAPFSFHKTTPAVAGDTGFQDDWYPQGHGEAWGRIRDRARAAGLAPALPVQKTTSPLPTGFQTFAAPTPVVPKPPGPQWSLPGRTPLTLLDGQPNFSVPATPPTSSIYIKPGKDVGKQIVNAVSAISARNRATDFAAANPFGNPALQVPALASGNVMAGPNELPVSQASFNDLGALATATRIAGMNEKYRTLLADGVEPGRAKRMVMLENDIRRGVGGTDARRALYDLKKENVSTRSEKRKLKEAALDRQAKYANAALDRDMLIKQFQDKLGISKKEAEIAADNALTTRMLAKNTIEKSLTPDQQLSKGADTAKIAALVKVIPELALTNPDAANQILSYLGIPALSFNSPEEK